MGGFIIILFLGSDNLKELYIDRGITQSRAAVYLNGKMEELYTENHEDESITGNIYKGRIENIVPGLNAAFVNIGTGKNAILHFKDEASALKNKKGNEILVQVIREAGGDKGSRVSEEISIPGKYIVLLPDINHVYISHKIKDEGIIDRLHSIAGKVSGSGFGIIFRTEAEKIENEAILEEISYLKDLWNVTLKKLDFIKPPQLVFNSRDFLSYITREYIKKDIDRVYVNRKEDGDYILDILGRDIKADENFIQYNHQDFRCITAMSNDILKNMGRKIILPSGGDLLVESTETLTTIDVNTGAYTGESNKEDTVLKTNQEACFEIFRVVKLLNLSGIIMIDFINMDSSKNKQLVRSSLKELFKNDRIPNSIYDFTPLGLLEMSRAKRGKPLKSIIYEDCNRSIFNKSYILKEIENKCIRYSRHYSRNNFDVYVNPCINEMINTSYKHFVTDMEKIYGIKVNFIKKSSIKDYVIDRDIISEPVSIHIADKKIFGDLVDYSEDNGYITVKIKNYV